MYALKIDLPERSLMNGSVFCNVCYCCTNAGQDLEEKVTKMTIFVTNIPLFVDILDNILIIQASPGSLLYGN